MWWDSPDNKETSRIFIDCLSQHLTFEDDDENGYGVEDDKS